MPSVKFLVLRFSSIGDIVLTTPVVRALKQQVENAEVYYFTKSQYKALLEANPYIDKIICLENNLSKQLKILKRENIDYIIDLHHNLRTGRIKHSLKRIAFSFDKLNLKKWLLVNFKINKLPDKHIVDRYFETVDLFDVKNDGKGLDYFIPPKDEVALEVFPDDFQKGYIAFVIGAKHNTKQLTIEKVKGIIQLLNYPVVFLGGKEDYQTAEKITSDFPGKTFNACGLFNINQSASIVNQSNLVITHDTGLMHIAAAFKKKIISVWGNTVPEFGMYPYNPHKESLIFENKGLYCRPCSKIGFKKCPKKHFRCINELDEKQIAESANKLF
ncbi:MAG: glycosyltransferase family 9 protein [Bacteroidales bacterium]